MSEKQASRGQKGQYSSSLYVCSTRLRTADGMNTATAAGPHERTFQIGDTDDPTYPARCLRPCIILYLRCGFVPPHGADWWYTGVRCVLLLCCCAGKYAASESTHTRFSRVLPLNVNFSVYLAETTLSPPRLVVVRKGQAQKLCWCKRASPLRGGTTEEDKMGIS